MSLEKWETSSWGERIKSVLVDRETETSVFIGKTRNAKRSSYRAYHDTWEEAHAYLLEQAEREVEAARRKLEYAQGRYGSVKGMKPPAPQKGKDPQ